MVEVGGSQLLSADDAFHEGFLRRNAFCEVKFCGMMVSW